MNFSAIFTVYCKELRDAVRDRRTMISVIAIPTLVMPLLFFGMGKVMTRVFAKAEAEIPEVMIRNGNDSPEIVAALKAARNAEQDRPLLQLVPTADDFKDRIINKRLAVAVEFPAGFDAAIKSGEFRTVQLNYFEADLKSEIAARALEGFFSDYRQKYAEQRLKERGLPVSLIKPYETKRQNVAPQQQVDGNRFGGFVPYLIIILCFTGAMYPAMDTTAGEKERGTMETLLCSPVSRINIVLGKFLLVLTGSLTAIVCTLLSMSVTATLAGSLMGSGGAKVAAARNTVNLIPAIDPFGIIGVLAMIAPVAVLFAAITLTVSLFAKSFKEAQSYLSPMIFLVVAPAMMGMLPGIELSAKTALVPILNLSLVCKEMLSGIWHWNYIALIFGSTALYAGIALALCVRMFNREDVMFRA